jgi:low temperature requirement protein LtrA
MSGRSTDEAHRASTPLELLFDLTFVVAVSRAAAELGHSVQDGQVGHGVLGYLMVFFAIWWAWMNFTWFASAYDTDDVPYRLLTLLQMGGVLVLAAGVHGAIEQQNFTTVVLGYVIMRVAMIAEWLRAAASDPEHRRTAQRYTVGTAMVQVGWIARLALPHHGGWGIGSFVLLAACELATPVWAERPNMTNWHPQHIAERYGLFTIIVLGECVLAASTAVEEGSKAGVRTSVVIIGVAGLVLLFALWWLYFLRDTAEGLHATRGSGSFRWGYGHYGVFASLAALGAGIEVAVAAASSGVQVSDLTVAYAVALPIAIYLLSLWWLREPLTDIPCPSLPKLLTAVIATLAIPTLAPVIDGAWVVAGLSLPAAVLVAASVHDLHRRQFSRPDRT